MQLPSCYLEHLDSLKLRHARRLISCVGLYGIQTTDTPQEILQDVHFLNRIVVSCPRNSNGNDMYRSMGILGPRHIGLCKGLYVSEMIVHAFYVC